MEKTLSRISVKGIKTGFGHDLAGVFANIYLDNKKVGHYNDDGWGGEVDLQLKPDAQNIIEDIMVANNMAQKMFDNGWDFMKEVSKIDIHTQIENTVFELINDNLKQKQVKQFEKGFLKDMVKGICIGTDMYNYEITTFKAGDLPKMMSLNPQGTIKAIKNQIIPFIKNGEKVLNTNLKELGINLED